MPELPEVQTIVNDLNKKVAGRKIVGVWFDWPKAIWQADGSRTHADKTRTNAEKFKKTITGKKILAVKRRAKNLLFYLSSADHADNSGQRRQDGPRSPHESAKSAQYVLLIHLKMTGHFLVGKWKIQGNKAVPVSPPEMINDPYNSYIHLIFYLDNGQQLALSDLRKFAKAILGTKEQIENLPELVNLGPEANDPDLKFVKFLKLIKSERRKIKQVLMDQEVIAGIGNIYSDEILWQSRIHPFKPANKLSEKEIRDMFKAMKQILAKALRLRGTSSSDYRDTAGKKGGYDKVRLAYDREGEPCQRCGAKIARKKIGGRSAHFCPKCQKL